MLRYSVFFLSILAAWGLGAALGSNPIWLDVLVVVGLVLVTLVAVLVLYGLLSDNLHRGRHDGRRPNFTHLPTVTRFSPLSFICLPGMVNGGDVTYRQHVKWLSRYGPVLIVNWPQYGFDGRAVARHIMDEIEARNLQNPCIIGASLGSVVGQDLLRLLRMSPHNFGQVSFIGVSAFTCLGDTKPPAPPFLSDILRDLPISRKFWKRIMEKQDTGVAKMNPITERQVSRMLLNEHHDTIHGWPYFGLAAQGRYLASRQLPANGEFAGVPALFVQTPYREGNPPGDVLLHQDVALEHLRSAFSDISNVAVAPGIHANLVELPHAYQLIMEPFISEMAKLAFIA